MLIWVAGILIVGTLFLPAGVWRPVLFGSGLYFGFFIPLLQEGGGSLSWFDYVEGYLVVVCPIVAVWRSARAALRWYENRRSR